MKWQHIKIISVCSAVTVFIGVQTKIIWQSFSVHIYSTMLYLSWRLKFFPFVLSATCLHSFYGERTHTFVNIYQKPQYKNWQISPSFHLHICPNRFHFSSSWLWPHNPVPSVSEFFWLQPLFWLQTHFYHTQLNTVPLLSAVMSTPETLFLHHLKEESYSNIQCTQ